MSQKQLAPTATEDYLKTIYLLSAPESPVTTSRIATVQQVKPASVTSMIQKLDKLGMVHYEKHHGVTLTAKGKRLALKTLRHHRLLELYLTEKLGFSWDEVHEEAERLEHVISEKFEERIADALGHPAFDPHGEPIPSKDGQITWIPQRPLASLSPGEQATVTRIADDTDREFLRHLAELAILPGAVIRVTAVAPYDGPITVDVGGQQQVVGHKAAATIFMELEKECE